MPPSASLPLAVIAHPDPGIADSLKGAVEADGTWRVITMRGDRDALNTALAGAAAALVGCTVLGNLAPGITVPVLAIGDPASPSDRQAADAAGAAGLLRWPGSAQELAGELARLAAASSPGGTVVIAVAGVAGGVGTTTLAAHLAGAWARWGSGPVLLADLAGGLGFRLDLSPTTPSWAELNPLGDRLDGPALTNAIASPWPGLAVVPLPSLPDGAIEPPPDRTLLGKVLTAARGTYRIVVLDVPPLRLVEELSAQPSDADEPPRRQGEELSAQPSGAPGGLLSAVDVLLLVARPDSSGLTALETTDAARAATGIPAARAGMVVMGASTSAPVSTREVRARLGERLWAMVPSSPAELGAAAEDGLLLLDRPEVPAVQAILALAHRVVPFAGAALRY